MTWLPAIGAGGVGQSLEKGVKVGVGHGVEQTGHGERRPLSLVLRRAVQSVGQPVGVMGRE